MDTALLKFTVSIECTLLDAIEAIKNNRSRCVMVMTGERVAGVLSEGDIMSALLDGADVHAPIPEFMHHNFKFLSSYDIRAALDLMRQFGVTLVPIVDHDLQLTGVITIADVLNVLKPGEIR